MITGDDLKAAAATKTDKQAWDDVLSALLAAGLTAQQRHEVMRRVAIWGAVCVTDAGKTFVADTKEVLMNLTKGVPS